MTLRNSRLGPHFESIGSASKEFLGCGRYPQVLDFRPSRAKKVGDVPRLVETRLVESFITRL